MECLVYRGINLQEAMQVMREKRYTQAERRIFGDGIYAKAVFGTGLYLVSDIVVAAEYAFCHAQTSQDKAAILSQTLKVENPLTLNESFGEKELVDELLDTVKNAR